MFTIFIAINLTIYKFISHPYSPFLTTQYNKAVSAADMVPKQPVPYVIIQVPMMGLMDFPMVLAVVDDVRTLPNVVGYVVDMARLI